MTYCKTLNCEVFLFFVKSSSGFPCGSAGKESACSAGDLGSIPGLERSPGEGKDYPLQYSDLENSMDYMIYGVTKSRTWLSDFHFPFFFFLFLGKIVSLLAICHHLSQNYPKEIQLTAEELCSQRWIAQPHVLHTQKLKA